MLWMKSICLLCLVLFGMASFSCAEDSSKTGCLEQPGELPFELYADHLIIAKGTIGWIENVNIILDTGKNPTAISPEMAVRLNLRGNPESLISSNGKIEVQSVVLPWIEIGALHVSSRKAVVQDLSFMQRSLDISIVAIAGLDLLSTGSFMIDYRKRKIIFVSAKAARKTVRFETQRPFLTVRGNIAGHELRLLVDSGTPRLLLFGKRLKTSLRSLEPVFNDRNPLIFTATGTMRAAWYRAPDVSLGTQSIGPQTMLVADGDPDPRYKFDGLLGLAKTGFPKVWLDFENGVFGWE
jgi:predicted aspartyl protease